VKEEGEEVVVKGVERGRRTASSSIVDKEVEATAIYVINVLM
jgi:hypothetical protein